MNYNYKSKYVITTSPFSTKEEQYSVINGHLYLTYKKEPTFVENIEYDSEGKEVLRRHEWVNGDVSEVHTERTPNQIRRTFIENKKGTVRVENYDDQGRLLYEEIADDNHVEYEYQTVGDTLTITKKDIIRDSLSVKQRVIKYPGDTGLPYYVKNFDGNVLRYSYTYIAPGEFLVFEKCDSSPRERKFKFVITPSSSKNILQYVDNLEQIPRQSMEYEKTSTGNERFYKNGNVVRQIIDGVETTFRYNENGGLIERVRGNNVRTYELDENDDLVKCFDNQGYCETIIRKKEGNQGTVRNEIKTDSGFCVKEQEYIVDGKGNIVYSKFEDQFVTIQRISYEY